MLFLTGCTPPRPQTRTTVLNPDQSDNIGGTGVESEDVRTAATKMAAALLSLPQIAGKTGGAGIAIAPVRNSTRHLIDKDIFTSRLRLELNKVSQGRVRFFSQGLGQEVRAEIIGSQDEESWDEIIRQCATAIVGSTLVKTATKPVRLSVIPIKKTNLVGQNADSLTALLRSAIVEAAAGKVEFLARQGSGKIISQVLAESDLRNVGLVIGSSAEKVAGVDYFLGGEFVANSLTPSSVGTQVEQKVGVNKDDPRTIEASQAAVATSPNATKYLNVMLIDSASGVVPFEKMVRVERKVKSGLERADFVLTGELRGLSKAADGGDRSDYIIMSFQLVDAQSNEIVWEDAYETKKVSNIGVIYK